MSFIKGPEFIILIVVILVLFGAKRMPDAARGLGRSLRIFKAETQGLLHDDDKDDEKDKGTSVTLTATQAAPATPVREIPAVTPVDVTPVTPETQASQPIER